MSVDAAPPRLPYQIFVIDEDPVFRLGVKLWLDRYPDLKVVAEVSTGEEALQHLEASSSSPAATRERSNAGIPFPDLVILDIGLGRSHPDRLPGLVLCQRLRNQYPHLKLLLLSASPEPILRAAAQQAGANGFGLKGVEAETLVAIIRRLLTGRSFFATGSEPLVESEQKPVQYQPTSRSLPSALAAIRHRLHRGGIQQIDAALAEVTTTLRSLELSLLDRAVVAGRQRELRAARRLVNWLLAPSQAPPLESSTGPTPPIASTPAVSGSDWNSSPSSSRLNPSLRPSSGMLAAQDAAVSAIEPRTLQSVLLDAVLAKLQSSLDNESEITLEIDILREDKKRELFYLLLRQFEDLLDELRHADLQPDQLAAKRSAVLLDLWHSGTTDFFGKYATAVLRGVEIEIVGTLLQDSAIVQTAILDKIPGVVELLAHLLFQMPLQVDGLPLPPGNPEALSRAELLTENLLIQLANAVMQPLLNRLSNLEAIKQNFYHRRLLSSREIERFRNNLSWRYRMEKYFRDPQDIFESQYGLLVLSWKGIKRTSIYASRHQELENLFGIPLAVTLVLETRDAIAPRLRSAISFVGSGVIYVLTEVVGRGIGLIGRGFLKGMGSAWQETRSRR